MPSSIVKYPGGKLRELPGIRSHMPLSFDRFVDPFVGGGSVFCGIDAKRYAINDKSEDLMNLYRLVARGGHELTDAIELVGRAWLGLDEWFFGHREMVALYRRYLAGDVSEDDLARECVDVLRGQEDGLVAVVDEACLSRGLLYMRRLGVDFPRKMARMVVLDRTRRHLPDEDVLENILGVYKAGMYFVMRGLYNDRTCLSDVWRAVTYLFMRDYCYSSMFRFSTKGNFNVPYGGISYNAKDFTRHVSEYLDSELMDRMSRTVIGCEDWEAFVRRIRVGAGDFLFLDPPYDSNFSTYDGNAFDEVEQRRLAAYLTGECDCDFMLVVKRTDLMDELYADGAEVACGRHLHVSYFDKAYAVSFMNRNDRKVTHMMVTNYGEA